MTLPRFASGLAEIADRFDCFMIDQYGVMHDGQAAYPGAPEAMTQLVERNKCVVVLTNSGKRARPNMERIGRLGFPRSSYTALVSSGEVTWQGLRTNRFGPPFESGGRVCLIGRQGADYGLDGLDLTFVEQPEAADFIIMAGSDCPHTSLDEYSNHLAPAARQHIPALCANPDRLMLTSQGLQPSSGAIGGVYESLGGRVTYIGKPFPAIYGAAAKLAGSDGSRVLCIGDSLDHDVQGGAEAGFETALVRTGILADVDDASLEAMTARALHQPNYVLPGLAWG